MNPNHPPSAANGKPRIAAPRLRARLLPTAKILTALFLAALPVFAAADNSPRRVLSLDGTWQIAEGKMDQVPAKFERTVPVPGLVSLATPAFDPPPGPPVAGRNNPMPKDPARDAFWYRRSFHIDGPVPAVARLKVSKAMFGTRVILNGKLLGDHEPNFTPGYFDARAALREGENVLLIRVGADRTAVPSDVPSGHDYEKQRYIPGIFDSVELILSGTPFFLNVQTVPDIMQRTVGLHVVLRNDGAAALPNVTFVVREAKSGRIVGQATRAAVGCATEAETTVDIRIPIADCRLWSPEDPFLYRLEADCGTDRFTTRFGMREFKLDPVTHRAVLNGRPYFMRGSNFTVYRFFEDPECNDLPWQADWVRLLHQRVKDMRWNCLRYCIGFPPERWYDMADELGILIQDEFPIWDEFPISGKGGGIRAELAREYADWMRERWNHPCVVIWDAQNETRSPEIGEALTAVRGLDLSGRPWDDGWGPIMAPTDSYEAHPYDFIDPGFILADLAHKNPVPEGSPIGNDGKHAVIINEYGWLWLNRDGSPTTLTRNLYRNLVGENATAEQRRHIYATYMAAETEFWRAHRKAAAVMHFTTLGYSRPDGQTSDHWIDIAKLTWEPEFHHYVRDAFAPVGLMVDFWPGIGLNGQPVHIPVRLINDLNQPWTGPVTLRLRLASGGPVLLEKKQNGRMEPVGLAAVEFDISWPEQTGTYIVEAELTGIDGEAVHSVREVTVVDVHSLGLAYRGKAFASSSLRPDEGPDKAVDGDPSTVWASAAVDPSWLAVDLGERRKISRVRVVWGKEFSLEFAIQVSCDALAWTDVHTAANDRPTAASDIRFAPVDARYVRVVGMKRRTVQPGDWRPPQISHMIRELQVFD